MLTELASTMGTHMQCTHTVHQEAYRAVVDEWPGQEGRRRVREALALVEGGPRPSED